MLVLTRHRDESIIVGDNILFTILEIRGDKVRVGIAAPDNVSIHREEVYLAIKREMERSIPPAADAACGDQGEDE